MTLDEAIEFAVDDIAAAADRAARPRLASPGVPARRPGPVRVAV